MIYDSTLTGRDFDSAEWNHWYDGEWATMFVLAPGGLRCNHIAELTGFIRADCICLDSGWHLFCCRVEPYSISPEEARELLARVLLERSGGGYLLPPHGSRESLSPEVVELLQRLAPDLGVENGDGTRELSEKTYQVRGLKMMKLGRFAMRYAIAV